MEEFFFYNIFLFGRCWNKLVSFCSSVVSLLRRRVGLDLLKTSSCILVARSSLMADRVL